MTTRPQRPVSQTAIQRWDDEGGAIAPTATVLRTAVDEPTLNRSRVIPHIDHKAPPDDDCGMPVDPIFSNYSKDLWPRPSQLRKARS